MRRLWIVVMAAVLATGVARGQQGTGARTGAGVQLEAAIKKEVVDGDLKAAIKQYQAVVEKYNKSDRGVAAQALVRMANCYQKLGDAQAARIYEQVIRDYADQKEAVTLARARIGDGPRPTVTSPFGLLCDDCDHQDASISRDGRWMATVQMMESGDLAIRDMTTRQVTRLFAKAGSWADSNRYAFAPVLSPDMKHVAYLWGTSPTGAPAELRIMANQRGAEPRILLNNPEFVWPSPVAWSADGKDILTVLKREDKTWQLAWVSVANGAVRIVKSLEWRSPIRPTVSPDGRFIAYSALAVNPTKAPPAAPESRIRHLYILAADGSSETELTKTAGIDAAPAWTPDGNFLVFSSNRTGSFDLWALPMRDGKATSVPSLVKRDIRDTGQALGITNAGAYVYFQERAGVAQVVVAQLDTTGKLPASVRLTESFIGSAPSWSPDGKFLEFARIVDSPPNVDLVLHAMDTGEEQRFSRRGLAPGPARWLHNSTGFLTVVRSAESGNKRSIYAIDAKSGAFREVVGPNTRAGVAALSPDDKTLYQFAGDPGGPREVFNRVVAVDLMSGQERVVLSLSGPVDALPTAAGVALALTPDGKTLAIAVSDPAGNCRLSQVGVDGAGHRDVFGPFKATDPRDKVAWTKDGRAILFATQEAARWRLMRVNAAGGQPEFTGLEMDGLGAFSVSPDGSRIAFSNNGVTASRARELWALDVSALLKKSR